MTGSSGTPGLLQRQPVAAAAGVTTTVGVFLVAFWSVASDYGWFSGLSGNTILLINNAVIVGVGLLSAWYAKRNSTPIAAPTLPAGTSVQTTDSAGNSAGSTTV